MEATYASKGVAGTGLGLGIAGTALALLQNGGLGNVLGGGWGCNGSAALLAAKDATIAKLEAELNSDRKLVQVWDNLNTKRESTDGEVSALEAQVAALTATLAGITKCVVPISAVCPTPAVATTTSGTNGTTTP